ncbi:MAG: hypothetical protein MSS60_10030 [Clostridiales bacterium]|nr:hypothetical protein [Clostridiales bacterium]
MTSEITNYQCPACTAPLRFDGESGRLQCDFCGSSYSVAEIEALYAEKDKAAADASEQVRKKAEQTAADLEDTGWEVDENLRAYQCPTCGAELITEKTTAATACPYCGNPSVVPGQLSGALKPEFVLPFKIEKEAAVAALHKHYGKRNFYLPKPFRSDNHIEKVQGVYVPFWLFDATVSGAGQYDGQDSVTHMEGDYEVTRTMHYNVERAGSAEFNGIPVDGSKKMPDNYMDSIEPFDYTQLKPFSTAYLPGFLADRYDVSAEEASPRMETRCKDTLEGLLRRDIDHSVVVPERFEAKVVKKEAHYALLPVWMLTTKWRDRTYLFAMNGQTGKFVGELPTDNGLFWRNLGVLTLIVTLVLRFSGITRMILSLFG